MPKTHAKLITLQQRRVARLPEDVQKYSALDVTTQRFVANFLLTKGLDVNEMFSDDVYYSAKDMRIIFQTPQGHIGRTVVNAEPKWCTYGVVACTHASFNLHAAPVVVLTEDYLSARKVVWACRDVRNVGAIAQLGTRISDAMLADMIQNRAMLSTLIGFYDGDKAGDEADRAARLRFQGLGLQYCSVQRDAGKDPKDHTAVEIRMKINEALNGNRNSNPTGTT